MNAEMDMLGFVKSKLEENEGIAPDALARLLAAATEIQANRKSQTCYWHRIPFLLAASLAIAACGWFMLGTSANVRNEGNLANVIELLRMADGDNTSATASLADTLVAWQDAPSLADGIISE